MQSPKPPPMVGRATASCQVQEELPPVDIRVIPIGDPKIRSKIRFEVVTAKVVEAAGKKHVVSSSSHCRGLHLRLLFFRLTRS